MDVHNLYSISNIAEVVHIDDQARKIHIVNKLEQRTKPRFVEKMRDTKTQIHNHGNQAAD